MGLAASHYWSLHVPQIYWHVGLTWGLALSAREPVNTGELLVTGLPYSLAMKKENIIALRGSNTQAVNLIRIIVGIP